MNRSDPKQTLAMYADYLQGMSCAQVGKKYHYKAETVWKRFKNYGLKTRPRYMGKKAGKQQ